MGGVDLHNIQVSKYHILLRSTKWWWPTFAWSLHNAIINRHLFHRDDIEGTIDVLTFLQIVAQSEKQVLPISQNPWIEILTATFKAQARYNIRSN